MSATAKKDPSYRLHRQSGQALVCLRDAVTGKRHDVLLGKHGTAASLAEYRRVVLEWRAAGGRIPTAGRKTGEPADVTVAEVLRAYWEHAKVYYRDPDGGATCELAKYKTLIRMVREMYAHTRAADLDQRALKAIRQKMMDRGWSRRHINDQVNKVRHMVKWAAEEQLVPASVYHALLTVSGLKCGRSTARETEPVKPVARAVVEETIAKLTPTVADMVRLQLETGMRPGELVIMRACDLDTSGLVWLYRPRRHKTQHFGHERIVPIGPRAQDIIRRHLKADTEAYLFSPADAAREQSEQRRAARKTKLWDSHVRHQEKKRCRNRARRPGERYDVCAYARAIARACELAYPPPEHLGPRIKDDDKRETYKEWLARLNDDEKRELREWRKVHHWHPHMLRHTRALELKREAGLDVARAVLGHRSPQITEMYATLDVAKAAEVMLKIG